LVAAVSPYRDQRDAVRREVERFIEVYCRCPLEVLAERDKNNLFARARSGEIAHVAGVNAPYEEPLNPDVIIDTNKQSMRGGVRRVMSKLEALGFMPPQTSAEYTADEEALIKQRLRDMGYI
jgi:adenylylsulfate kinase-like enzyme